MEDKELTLLQPSTHSPKQVMSQFWLNHYSEFTYYIYDYICYLQLSQIVYYNSVISLNNSPSLELIVKVSFFFALCSRYLSKIHIKTLPEVYITSQYIITQFFQYPPNLLWNYHSYSHSPS